MSNRLNLRSARHRFIVREIERAIDAESCECEECQEFRAHIHDVELEQHETVH